MDFDFTQEQVMLRDLTREFLTRESTPRAVRTLMDDPRGFSDATWQQMAEMGLPGLAIDAGYGGQGLGMVELALVLDEMGRAALPGPVLRHGRPGRGRIAASGQDNQMARYLPDIAAGRTQATLALVEDALSWAPAASAAAERRGRRLRAVTARSGSCRLRTWRTWCWSWRAPATARMAGPPSSRCRGTRAGLRPDAQRGDGPHRAHVDARRFDDVAVPARRA